MIEVPLLERARVARLIEVLLHVEPSKFDMSHWWTHNSKEDCHTAGCAAGHAARDDILARQGLRLAYQYLDGAGITHYVPYYRGRTQLPALELFFGMTPAEAAQIFNPAHIDGIGPEHVATKLTELLECDAIGLRAAA